MTGRWIELDVKCNKSGSLVPLESQRNIPFAIRRAFFIYDIETGGRRGMHAQRTLKEALICVQGSCQVRIEDGRSAETFRLDRRDRALYIGPMEWREMYDFSEDCILLALADQLYDESDYIRDHGEYERCLKTLS